MTTIIRMGDDVSVGGSLSSDCICICKSHNATEVPGDQEISRLTQNKMSTERTLRMTTIIRLVDDVSVRGSLSSVCICISQSHNATEVPGERTYPQDDHADWLG